MSDIDFDADFEIECAVRGIDLHNAEHASHALEVLDIMRAETRHAALRAAQWEQIHALRALEQFLGGRQVDAFSTADVVRLFSDARLKHAFELTLAAMKKRSRPSAPKEMGE